MSKQYIKLYGVVGRAIFCPIQVDEEVAQLLEVDTLLDIGRECYEIRSMIEQDDLFLLNLCCVRNHKIGHNRNRIKIDVFDQEQKYKVA